LSTEVISSGCELTDLCVAGLNIATSLFHVTLQLMYNALQLPVLHTHPFNGPLSGTTQVSRYQKGNTNLDFTEARDSECQWHQLGHMQVCTSLQTDNHASTPPLCFFTGRMPFLPRNQQRQSTEGTHTLLPLLHPFNGLFSRTTLALLQSCILSTFVLVNEYECVDPVHPLHGNTSNFPTVSLD